MSRVLSILSRHPVFESLSPEQLEAVLAAGFSCKYAKSTLVALAGEAWPYLFLVLEGRIQAFKESSEGRSLMIGAIESGELFWGLAFFHPEVGQPASLEASEDSELYLWEHDRLLPFLLQHGRVSWELSRLMVTRMLRASDLVEGLAFQPVAGRVARFLLEQAPPDMTPSPRDLTLDQIAAHTGTTREVVCRYLRSFSDEGLIHITRTEYQVTDRDGLERVSRQVKG